MAFVALRIDPRRHVAEFIELQDAAAPPEPLTYTLEEQMDLLLRDGRGFVAEAGKTLTPRSHWLIIDKLLDGALLPSIPGPGDAARRTRS